MAYGNAQGAQGWRPFKVDNNTYLNAVDNTDITAKQFLKSVFSLGYAPASPNEMIVFEVEYHQMIT